MKNYFLMISVSLVFISVATAQAPKITPQALPSPDISSAPIPYGQSLPAGVLNQTLRHNGFQWVTATNLLNDGQNVAIGLTPNPAGPVRLRVVAVANDASDHSAISGENVAGHGVDGSSFSGVGVYGNSYSDVGILGVSQNGISIKAAPAGTTNYGFYQDGRYARNYFAGRVGIGVEPSPTTTLSRLEVNGGMRLMPQNPSTTPVCFESIRGLFWIARGGEGVDDQVQVCIRQANGAYGWRSLY